MRRIVFTGAMIIGALAVAGAPSEAQFYHQPAPSWYRHPGPPRSHGGWYPGGTSHYVGRGGYVTNWFGDGRPPVFNRPGDGLPPLPAQRLPNGQYIVNRPGDGLRPFVVGRPRY